MLYADHSQQISSHTDHIPGAVFKNTGYAGNPKQYRQQLLEKSLSHFSTISLQKLQQRATLLHRQETKYLIHRSQLPQILTSFNDTYDVLQIQGKRVFSYDSIYFDSPDAWTYHQHHQGKRLRAKIRTRSYRNDSSLTFFEIKLKHKQYTNKKRFRIDRTEHGTLSPRMIDFVQKHYTKAYQRSFSQPLDVSLAIMYDRITLVHRHLPARFTIDYNIQLSAPGMSPLTLYNTAVLESKTQTGQHPHKNLLQPLGIKPIESCSKYCLGNILLFDRKHNRFKPLIKQIESLELHQIIQ